MKLYSLISVHGSTYAYKFVRGVELINVKRDRAGVESNNSLLFAFLKLIVTKLCVDVGKVIVFGIETVAYRPLIDDVFDEPVKYVKVTSLKPVV